MALVRGKLEIELDPTIITDFDIPTAVLNGNYLVVTILTPDDYTPRYTSSQEYKESFTGLYPVSGPVRYSFDFNMKDPRKNIYKALEMQAIQSNSTINPNSTIQLITLRDYCEVDTLDFRNRTPGQQPFTTRRGSLWFNGDLKTSGTWYDSVKDQVENVQGMSWTFHQIDLR